MEDQEWLFFEATEQRIKAWTQRDRENALALWSGQKPPHDPLELAQKRASIVQEMDYPDRLEAALRDPDLTTDRRRRLEMHQRWAVETAYRTHPEIAEVENDLRQAHAAFTPRVAGRPADWSELEAILRQEANRDLREEAWKAVQPLARDLEAPMGELLRLREAWAQSMAGSGFAQVAGHVQEMDRTAVVNLMDEVERTTRGPMSQLMEDLSRAAKVPDLEPWDYAYGLNQWWPLSPGAFDASALQDAVELQCRRWGWEPTKLDLTWHAGPHPGRPRVWGGPGRAVLLSRPGNGPWSYDRLFRAYGQALHRALIPESRFFVETPSLVQTHATGAWFARVLTEPQWLAEHTGAAAQTIDQAVTVLRAYHMLRLRYHIAHHAFENVAYTHAGLEPTRLFQDVLEQVFQGVREQTSAWAAMRSSLEEPMTQAAPVLGAVLGGQLWDATDTDDRDTWRSEEAASQIWETWIRGGGSVAWTDALQTATKQEINLNGLCRWLGLERFEGPRLDESESATDAQVEEYFKDIDLSDLDL